MKIERVQYDGDGEWVDVHFSDGVKVRYPAVLLRGLLDLAESGKNFTFSPVGVEELPR